MPLKNGIFCSSKKNRTFIMPFQVLQKFLQSKIGVAGAGWLEIFFPNYKFAKVFSKKFSWSYDHFKIPQKNSLGGGGENNVFFLSGAYRADPKRPSQHQNYTKTATEKFLFFP